MCETVAAPAEAPVVQVPAKALQQTSAQARDAEEPILKENRERFSMFPIKYQSVWEMYKKAEASFWTGARARARARRRRRCGAPLPSAAQRRAAGVRR